MQDFDTGNQGLHPELRAWLGLNNKSTLVKGLGKDPSVSGRVGLWMSAPGFDKREECME